MTGPPPPHDGTHDGTYDDAPLDSEALETRPSQGEVIRAGPSPAIALADRPDGLLARLVTAFLLGQRSEHTRRAYRADIRHYLSWCDDQQVDPLAARRVHLDAYVESMAAPQPRTGHPTADSTVARRLSTLAGLYTYAVTEGVLNRSPLAGLRRPRLGQDSTSTGLDRAELGRLLGAAAAAGTRAHALILLLALNGLRVDEALSRDVEHLQTERGHQVLRLRRKGGRAATAPLAAPVVHAVAVYLDGRTSGPLFVTRTGRRLDEPAAWRLIRRLAHRAELPQADRINPHSLRHTFVTAALDAGVQLRDVQDAAGHADPRTTRLYDRSRHNLDRHATYAVTAYLAEDTDSE